MASQPQPGPARGTCRLASQGACPVAGPCPAPVPPPPQHCLLRPRGPARCQLQLLAWAGDTGLARCPPDSAGLRISLEPRVGGRCVCRGGHSEVTGTLPTVGASPGSSGIFLPPQGPWTSPAPTQPQFLFLACCPFELFSSPPRVLGGRSGPATPNTTKLASGPVAPKSKPAQQVSLWSRPSQL